MKSAGEGEWNDAAVDKKRKEEKELKRGDFGGRSEVKGKENWENSR